MPSCRRDSPAVQAKHEKVQDYMNPEEFAREPDGRGLAGLAKEKRARCEQLLGGKGERLPY